MRRLGLVMRRSSMMAFQVPGMVSAALLAAGSWEWEENMALFWRMRDGDCLMQWRQLDVSVALCSSRTMRAGSSVGKTATMRRSATVRSKEIVIIRSGCPGESRWRRDGDAVVYAGSTAYR